MTAQEVFIRRENIFTWGLEFNSIKPDRKQWFVVYRWHGRLWRCSESEWKRLLAEQIKEKVK